jgi:hypothetical protein
MFIAWDTARRPAPFGGAELNLTSTRPGTFRSSEQRPTAIGPRVLYTFHP